MTNYTNRNYHNNEKIIWWKEILCLVGWLLLAAIIIGGLINLSMEKYSDRYTGRVKVEWSELNLREGPSTNAEVIRTLRAGDYVDLTGTYKETIDHLWVETTNGWVVVEGLRLNH